jgi:hemerythrin
MADYKFEFADAHRREHRELFYEIKHQLDDLLDGETTLSCVTVFMQRWLLRHIAGADRLLGEALRREQDKATSAGGPGG